MVRIKGDKLNASMKSPQSLDFNRTIETQKIAKNGFSVNQ